jgi:hypothetical protein
VNPFVTKAAAAAVLLAGLAAGSRGLPAQSPAARAPLSAARLSADSAFTRKDFAGAVALYRRAVAGAPNDGVAWNRLGASYYQLGRFADAADAYERAFRTAAIPYSRYNAAAAHARAGHADRTIAILDSMARGGFSLPRLIAGDSDFTAIRSDPRFQSAFAIIQRNATPCASEPKARQLDFWVGEWDVTGPQGPAGTSSVQLILGSCVVFENWTGRMGDEGKSFNIYNAPTDEWQQYWVTDRAQASSLFTQGVYADGKLQYRHAEFKGPDGKTWLRRLTFFNLDPNNVRQLSERSGDGGGTWATEYDLHYTRRR